ncbi:hypothetical protein SPRG_15062 [Saprolegnia parasitica CBS 223.65]|uniref:Uncharacterized protein n=1 Tax=Saprolegnia parasitica (strain CBS 223.65) TaxID=695850 RepID=A0A067BYV8_SAPPC|nr:hypothetical protein SPRG_15062 [Saprolegnia parasitica CBS 223.65]KDO19732.1 hypothetical protein SPRG_15062 [Saprolegnia parasitica CBS 223.65]|eukprot:XP_012209543.1 hypothetical protein SPRG_15062 [Saprolegnia parasitica CBS 223.65]
MLLSAHARTNVYNYERNTPLLIAAINGHIEPLRALLKYDADVDLPNDDGWTPLLCACDYGHVDCVKQLLAANATVTAVTSNGSTALLLATKKGNTDIVRVLLAHPETALNARLNSGGMTAVMIAAAVGNVNVLQQLLDADADFTMTNHTGRTALMLAAAEGHTHIVSYLLQHNVAINVLDNNGASALTMATGDCRRLLEREVLCRIVRDGDLETFEEILQDNPALDLEQTDETGTTLLMRAAANGHPELVKLLLDRNADIDAAQADGWSALMYAASFGHDALVQLLLENNAQIGGTDKGGKTAFMVAKDKAAFVKLILEKNATDLRFNEVMFKGAIECDPKLGKEILDAFLVEEGRYSLSFRDLDRIYGKESVEKSALYSILTLESEDDAQNAVKAHCLQHIIMRRVLQLKWEFFAQRMYIEQCLVYILLLASSVISGCIYQLDEDPNTTNIFSLTFWTHARVTKRPRGNKTHVDDEGIQTSFMIWFVFVVYVFVAYVIAHFGLKPKRLWSLAGWCRDGTYRGLCAFLWRGAYVELNWGDENIMPDAPLWKAYAKKVLFFHSIFWTGVLCLPFLLYLGSRTNAEMTNVKDQYQALNNIVLWGTAFYFFYWEYKELQGYGLRKYMSNAVNAVQILVFLLIMLVYVPCQLGFIPESVVVREYQLCMSGTICLALWILSLQYLEVHPTAGYLLPMMRGLLLDSVRFSILYGVFQVGLTCAYYILLQGSDGYESVLHTFITVYFVLFGQIQTGPIDDLASTSPVLSIFSKGLLMFHMAIAIVLLLNVLIAMMNNTLVEGLEKAKLEALASYANCVLRLELSLDSRERTEMIYVIKPKFLLAKENAVHLDRSLQTGRGKSDEAKPLLALKKPKKMDAHVGILNPAFHEVVLKSDYKTGYEQKGSATEDFQVDMRASIAALKKDQAAQLQQVKSQLSDMARVLQELQTASSVESGSSSIQD